MKLMAFVVWMLGWPGLMALDSLGSRIFPKVQAIQAPGPSDGAVFVFLAIWAIVGYLVYRKC